MPGLLGWIAGNAELNEFMVLSGVIVLLGLCGADRFVTGGEMGGVDQEKAAAGEALFDVLPRLGPGLEGSMLEEVADAGALAQGSPPSIFPPFELPCLSPLTRASKSPSPPFMPSFPFAPGRPPKLIKSLREDTFGAFAEPSSWSFLVCSFSTRAESDLIRVMYAWNWDRLSSGPRLNCHKIGRTSMARKSASTWLPMALKTSSAAS